MTVSPCFTLTDPSQIDGGSHAKLVGKRSNEERGESGESGLQNAFDQSNFEILAEVNKYLQQCGHKVEAVCHPLDLNLVVDVLFGGQVGAYRRVVVERVEACLKSFTDNFCEGLKGSVNMFWLTLSRMSCSTMPAPVLMVYPR